MIELDRQFGKVSLTERERDILRLLTNGLTDSEIAEAVILTVGTVKWYNRQIYSKLGVRNRTEAITQAQRLGLLRSASPAAAPVPSSRTGTQSPRASDLVHWQSQRTCRTENIAAGDAPGHAHRAAGDRQDAPCARSRVRAAEHYQDGVYFVSLASIQDASLVAHTIAQVLNVKESGSESIIRRAEDGFARQTSACWCWTTSSICFPAAPLVSDLLAAAPHLTVLVTSREILRLYGEQEFPVPPLRLPDLKQRASAAALQSYEAIELFIQRAHAAQPTFALERRQRRLGRHDLRSP